MFENVMKLFSSHMKKYILRDPLCNVLFYQSIHYLLLIQGRVEEAAGLEGYYRPPSPK